MKPKNLYMHVLLERQCLIDKRRKDEVSNRVVCETSFAQFTLDTLMNLVRHEALIVVPQPYGCKGTLSYQIVWYYVCIDIRLRCKVLLVKKIFVFLV